MAFARPFAYNPGSLIPGTEQLGDLSIGAPTSGFTNNPQYWNGPDEDLGYVIAVPVPDNSQPTQLSGITASVGFYRSSALTESSFVELTNSVFGQSFTDGVDAKTWLNNNGYWTSYQSPLLVSLDAGNPSSYSGTGNIWYDLSGNNNDATLINTPTYSPSYNGILQFDDASLEYATIPNIGNLTNWTVETWFRLTSPLTGKVTSIVSNQFNLTNKLNYSIGTNNMPSNNNLTAGYFDGGWHNVTGVVPNVNTWYQVVGTYDGSTIRQYVNGVPSGGTLNYVGTPQSGGEVRLMRRWDSPLQASNLVDGDLAIVKIYSEVLTDSDVLFNYNNTYSRFIDPTPTPTPTSTNTPTPSVTNTQTPTNTPTGTAAVTPTPTNTQTPTPSVTQTASATPTNTPTPSATSIPVTGFGYNLIALPYNFPASGNSIMNNNPASTGSTLINQLTTSGRGFYFNSIDNIGVNRTSHYSQYTGQSVTITFTQNGDSAIYSGDSQSFKFWSGNTGDPGSPIPGTGFVFGTGISAPPATGATGSAVLIQSATTTWVTGATVYVSVEIIVPPTPSPTPTNTKTPTVTPTNTPTNTPTVTPTNPTLLQILNQTTGSRTVTSCTLDGVSQTLTSGSFPITAGNNGYALTHDASVLPNSIQFNFGGSGAFDLYSYKNGVLVNYLQSYNSSSYVAGGITLLTSDQLVLIITDPNALPTPTPTTTSTSTPTPTTTTTRTPTPTTTTTRTPTPTNTPSSGIDAIRAALSTSVAAYDAATVGNFIKVTQAEYTNVFATVVGTTKYVMNDTDLNSADSGWSTGFNISYNDTINSIGSIPSNNYIIGYAYRGNSNGEVTTYLRTGTTANGTHTKIGANVNYTDIGPKTVYFIRKAPPTATTSKVYLSFFMNGIALGQVSGKTNYPIFYSSGINTNTWTAFNGGYPTFQSLATTTKSW